MPHGELTIKKPIPPAVIVVTLAVVVAFLGFLLFKGAGGTGQQVQGVESMPPNVRKAFMGAQQGKPNPDTNR